MTTRIQLAQQLKAYAKFTPIGPQRTMIDECVMELAAAPPGVSPSRLIRYYRQKPSASSREAAREFGVDCATIVRMCKAYGIHRVMPKHTPKRYKT